MREGSPQAPKKKQSLTKCKRSDEAAEDCLHENRSKKRKVESDPQTVTLRPHLDFPTVNRFAPIIPSSSRSVRRFCERNTKATTLESNRRWVSSSHDPTDFAADRLVVVSYNILGVENAFKHPDLYSGIPREFLKWARRKRLICKEIKQYNAGILCFQEVDRFDDLDNLLQKDGFRGIYKARTGEACDGCAMFWKDKMFTLLHEEHIEFRNFGLRDNVAQLCVLKINDQESETETGMQAPGITASQSRSFVVGNIHVLFNPNRGDVKLGQVRLLLQKAYHLSQEWGSIPVIIGGDLNSIPESAMYQFLSSSELDILLHDRRKISGQLQRPAQQKHIRFPDEHSSWSEEELKLATGRKGVGHLRHELKLSSAYARVPGSSRSRGPSGEPLATSYHSKFMGTVDYIWHTKELVPLRVLETLPLDDLRRSAGLPSQRCGSDHLALVCELAFLDDDDDAH